MTASATGIRTAGRIPSCPRNEPVLKPTKKRGLTRFFVGTAFPCFGRRNYSDSSLIHRSFLAVPLPPREGCTLARRPTKSLPLGEGGPPTFKSGVDEGSNQADYLPEQHLRKRKAPGHAGGF